MKKNVFVCMYICNVDFSVLELIVQVVKLERGQNGCWVIIEYFFQEVILVNYFVLQYVKGVRIDGKIKKLFKKLFKIKSDMLRFFRIFLNYLILQ